MKEGKTCVIFDTRIEGARGLEVGRFNRPDVTEQVRDELKGAGFKVQLMSERERRGGLAC